MDNTKKPNFINKVKPNFTHRQADNFIPWNLYDPLPDKNLALGQIHALNQSELDVLDFQIRWKKKYKLVYTKHQTIADVTGWSVSTVKRAINKLQRLGLIAVKNNGANKSCWYKTSSWFNSIYVMESLSKVLSIFYFTILSLMSQNSANELRSTNVFNFIYKIASCKQPKKEEQLERKEESQRKILKKKGKQMFEAIEISEYVKKLPLKLSVDQQVQLSRYSEQVLASAFNKLKSKKNPRDPVRYFFWLCKLENENRRTPQTRENNSGKKQQPRSNWSNENNNFDSSIVKEKNDNPSGEFSQRPIMYNRLSTPNWFEVPVSMEKTANEISKILDHPIPAGAKLLGIDDKYRDKIVINHCQRNFIYDSEIALEYINKYRIKFGLPALICPVALPQI